MKEFQMINILKIIFSNARKIAWIGFFTALTSTSDGAFVSTSNDDIVIELLTFPASSVTVTVQSE